LSAVLVAVAPATSGFARAHRPQIRPLVGAGEVAPKPFSRWPRLHLHLVRPKAGAAIVGGKTASQGQFAFMAFVIYLQSNTTAQICSGTVVSPNAVLTAGHCGVDENSGQLLDPSKFEVVTGSVDWTSQAAQVSKVSRVVVDPAYDSSTADSDAAVLVLSAPVRAPSVRVASASDLKLEQPGTSGVIAGWGQTSANSDTPNVLRWGTTVVQPASYCSQFSSSYDAALQLCALDRPNKNVATCNGDSGGPLLTTDATNQPVEIGITSYGSADCDSVTADYFTAVEPVSAWIDTQIRAAATLGSTSAPPPPSTTASARTLPRMTATMARSFARRTLSGAVPVAFRQRRSYVPGCLRLSQSRFNCGFRFSTGAEDYYGHVIVFFVGGRGGRTYWTDSYLIHWAGDRCSSHSPRGRVCAIHTKRGSW
jgi:V8-like Glu-specific endopeptidase